MELGDGSGFDVLQLARQTHPESCVVLMSGDADPETVQAALDLGAARFLPKPFTFGALLDAIKLAQDQAPAAPDDADQPSGTVSRF
jgi:DNA-binding NarL/FixJ family response regulator